MKPELPVYIFSQLYIFNNFFQSWQGSSFNTPKPQRKQIIQEKRKGVTFSEDDDEDEEDDDESEEETETETERLILIYRGAGYKTILLVVY